MDTNFFSGSENLYKYLVTVGILLIALTVYYPLKEKQELEILTINLEKDVETLHFKIAENDKEVLLLKENSKDTLTNDTQMRLKSIVILNSENKISQIESKQKYEEIKVRRKHIQLYNVLFWIFFPIGIAIASYGFYKWKKSKETDDEISELEKKKLEIEIKKLEES